MKEKNRRQIEVSHCQSTIESLLKSGCPALIGEYWESFKLNVYMDYSIPISSGGFGAYNPELRDKILSLPHYCVSPTLYHSKEEKRLPYGRCSLQGKWYHCYN